MDTMRPLTILVLFTLAPLCAQASDEKDALAAAQKVFDGMASHDAAMIRSAMLPDARLYSARDEAAPAPSTSGGDFADRIAAIKESVVERFTERPRVLIHGRIGEVWGEYEFLRDGKFNHCGVDSFSLVKTGEGWKVASITDSRETVGCKGR
jgi:hypothetical protein